MRLAVSNIAWDVSEDEDMASLLNRYGVDAIDIAPGKYFPDPANATEKDISAVKSWWAKRGIEITGMQALLFGTTGLNMFGSPEVQEAMLRHLAAVCRIGAGLGATSLVFGSPKNRDRNNLSDQQVIEIAIPFFRRLGDIAQSYGVTICLEPNPVCYGANFMTTSAETAKIVGQVAHPGIKMQLDIGALAINEEVAATVLQNNAVLIGHIHASEPNLVPLGDSGIDHTATAAALNKWLPGRIVSIEMLPAKNESNLTAIERAIGVAIRYFKDTGKQEACSC